MKSCLIVELGLIGYAETWTLQKRLVAARKANAIEDVLLLCEHPHVITLGRNGKREHLLASEHVLKQKGVELHATDRDVRMLEEAMIRATAEFGVSAGRLEGKTGIWVRTATTEEKLAAIGVHISRWVTSHGFAYNVSTDLRFFDLIVPCGIADRKATSLEKVLGRSIERKEVAPQLIKHLGEVFGLEMKQASRQELLEKLEQAERPVVLSA